MVGMTLLRLPDDGLRTFAAEGRLTFVRALQRLRVALRTMHRAIVAAKMRRFRNQPAFQADGYDEPCRGEDAARYPQQLLILGDKWDF
jgi:hypothetical protein